MTGRLPPGCHPERSEGSPRSRAFLSGSETRVDWGILRFAQDDSVRSGLRARVRLLASLLLLACLSCRRDHAPQEGAARRVVSLSPSTTETMFAIGAGALLVGRSRYCDYPPEVLGLPEVGGYVDPSVEAVLALRPDLVTGARGPAGPGIAERFTARGIASYFPATESLAEIDDMIVGLGARTGHADGARATLDRIHARVAGIERAVLGRPRVRTLLVFGLAPIVAAGPGSFADELLAHAGGENVVKEGGKYPTLGFERVMALAPDAIVDMAMGESSGRERITPDAPGWREVSAVKRGRVVSITDEVVLRPGPRVGEGLALLARAVHPEAPAP